MTEQKIGAARYLRERAESYRKDAAAFYHAQRPGGTPILGSELDHKWEITYRVVAGELEQAASRLENGELTARPAMTDIAAVVLESRRVPEKFAVA